MARRDPRKTEATALPHQAKGRSLGDRVPSFIRAAQGNFDHLMGVIRNLVSVHNSLVDDVDDLREFAKTGLQDTAAGDHTHDGSENGGGTLTLDHGGLTGLADDDHPQYTTGAEATAIADAEIATHAAAADPHTGYQKESEKGAANGYASLGADTLVPQDQLGTGVQDGTKFLRDDGTWQVVTPPASGIEVQEGDVQVAAAATVLDFDASDFNVTESPAGEANIALAYGTAAGTPAEGNHTHAGSGGGGTLVWSSKVNIIRGSQSRRIYIPSTWDPLAISFCYVSLPEANTGSCIVDVHKNGTTIYTTQANRPTVTAGFVSAEKVPDVTTVAPGDYFECIIDQVGAGTRGRVQVYIVLA